MMIEYYYYYHCQLADLFTKALNFNQFSSLVCKMGMINIHSAITLEGEYQNEGHKGTCRTKMKLNNTDCSLKHKNDM